MMMGQGDALRGIDFLGNSIGGLRTEREAGESGCGQQNKDEQWSHAAENLARTGAWTRIRVRRAAKQVVHLSTFPCAQIDAMDLMPLSVLRVDISRQGGW